MVPQERNHSSGRRTPSEDVPPAYERPESPKAAFHPSLYLIVWVTLSSSVLLFNQWILDKRHFHYPILLTTWHLVFATAMTQVLALTTKLLDGRKTVKMTSRVYLRSILPIGVFFILSLICGNLAYDHLNLSFIQMIKATTPVAVLLASWALGVSQPHLGVLFNVSIIVAGVALASFGNIRFVLKGFLYQCGGIVCEALRLVLVQRLLNGANYKMDPIVSLYYFAPICALMSGLLASIWEVPKFKLADILAAGIPELIANALVAFLMNVSAVFLIGKTSALVLTLCVFLKDILLVVHSMILGTPVSDIQVLGYTIALFGLLYYKIGNEAGLRMKCFPGKSLIRIFGVVLAALIILSFAIWGLAPNTVAKFGPKNDPTAYITAAADNFGGGGV